MVEYYFDMETTGTDFDTDEIITIQWQMLDRNIGVQAGELKILKRWDFLEKEIIETFLPNLRCRPFDFIFIGKNLLFDFCLLNQRMKHYGLGELDLRCLNERAILDIKPILVLMNDGTFIDYDKVLPKTNPLTNKEIPQLYRDKKYPEIIGYIEDEAKDFIEAYRKLKNKMPSLRNLL